MLLISLIEEPNAETAIWLVEFDGVLVGRFTSKGEVAAYLRRLGHPVDPDESWSQFRLL